MGVGTGWEPHPDQADTLSCDEAESWRGSGRGVGSIPRGPPN
jgi:hypothetical protein